jgi:hypothetical protein
VPVKFARETDTETDWLVKLREDTAIPATVSPSVVFRYEPGKSTDWLEPADTHTLIIRKELTAGQVLEGGFFEALRPYILSFKYAQAIPMQADFRRVDLAGSNWKRKNLNKISSPLPGQYMAGHERTWLGLLALALLTLERIWPK